MLLFILYGILASLLALIIGLVIYARWHYGELEALGIPVAERSFFLGSNSQLHKRVQHIDDIKRWKKFGPFYGVYEGREPTVYICDYELIKRITVTDYNHFHNRREFAFGDPVINEFLDFQQGEKYKILRTTLWNPFFNVPKLKRMQPKIFEAAIAFNQHLQEQCESNPQGFKVELKKLANGFLGDAIGRSVYGMNIQNPYDPNNIFAKNIAKLFGEDMDITFFHTLTMSFPFIMNWLGSGEFGNILSFLDTFKQILATRRSSGIRQNDILDELNDCLDKVPSPEYKKCGITELSIYTQALSLIIAGFDPMGQIVQFMHYFLCQNKRFYDKLRDEIDRFWAKTNGNFDYEDLRELVFLSACIKETERLIPPFIRFERICTKDWECDGVRIKKGMVVQIPIWAVHRNPEYFPDPETFDPERFTSKSNENNLNAFFTFGNGPKNCVGMKFSQQILLTGLVHIVRNFRFEMRGDTKINYKAGAQIVIKYDPIYFDYFKRNV